MRETEVVKGSQGLLTLIYGYGTANNGNVASQEIRAGGAIFTQIYGYDGLNRLKTVSETSTGTSGTPWSQTYSYDRYGNRAVTASTHPVDFGTPQALDYFRAANNRMEKYFQIGVGAAALTDSAYDQRGNLINHPHAGVMTYDADNMMVAHSKTQTSSYSYDGMGRRVKAVAGGTTRVMVYDASGRLAAEYGGTGPTALQYVSADMLGSTRLLTNDNGDVTERKDYLPFGEAIPAASGLYSNRQAVLDGGTAKYNAGAGVRQAFTGKERDAESGLDYFGARYMASAQGRFTSADPYIFQNATGQHATDATEQDQLRDRYISNPLVWNKYAYGLNNPLKFIDPDGKCSQPTNQKEGETGICVEAFIAQKWIGGPGRGDNRGFSGTDKDQTARSRVKLTVSKDGKVTSQEVESARSGVLVKGMGLRGDTVAQTEAKPNADGSVSVHVSLWGRNGEAGLPFAPEGVLQGHFNLNVSKSGQVSFVPQGSSATTFPSWGVYGYGSNGSVQTVKEIPERKIEDLQKPPAPIR